jgi:hypothetical protein
MIMGRGVLVCLLFFLFAPEALSQFALEQASPRNKGSLTTLFSADDGYAGNMFDITPSSDIQEITGLEINVSKALQAVEIYVYWKEGTCVGHDQDPGAWLLLGTGVAVSKGLNEPTVVDLEGNGIPFLAGRTYGFYVHLANYPSLTSNLAFTSGGPATFSNVDLSLTAYYGKGYPAFGSTFAHRIWNGTLRYRIEGSELLVYPSEISAWYGGTAFFHLNGGKALAGRNYALLGTVSGTAPGLPLPGGLTLPVNWDWFTDLLVLLAVTGSPFTAGHFGQLDANGYALASLTLPGGFPLAQDLPAHFAWCAYQPFDFVSREVEVTFKRMPSKYRYDDGTSENALGWTSGGELVWAHYFDAGVGDTLTEVASTFGSSNLGGGPLNGEPCRVYIWDDPTEDNDPVDAVLVGQGSGVIANTNTNLFNHYPLDAPAAVQGGFFAACHCWQGVGVYAAPMDEAAPAGADQSWFMGGAVFDPADLTTTVRYNMKALGYEIYWLLRADG